MRGNRAQIMTFKEVEVGLCQRHNLANLVRSLHGQALGDGRIGQELIPSGLGKNKSKRTLSKGPSLAQDAIDRLVLDLVADGLDERTDALFKDSVVGLADGARVPDMDDAVDRFILVTSRECNEKNDSISRQNREVDVIHGDVDGLIPADWQLSDGLDNISHVARGCEDQTLVVELPRHHNTRSKYRQREEEDGSEGKG